MLLQAEPGWTIFHKTGHSSMHALQFDLGQAHQGFLASLTNFWPHQLQPVQGNNCRPNVSAIPRQALLVLTPASRSLSRPWRPFMFFAFPSQFWPRPTAARPGRADPVAAASLFFFPLASLAKAQLVAGLTLAFRPGFDSGLPWSGRVPDARVWLFWVFYHNQESSFNLTTLCALTSFLRHCQTLTTLMEGWIAILNPLNNGPNALRNCPHGCSSNELKFSFCL